MQETRTEKPIALKVVGILVVIGMLWGLWILWLTWPEAGPERVVITRKEDRPLGLGQRGQGRLRAPGDLLHRRTHLGCSAALLLLR